MSHLFIHSSIEKRLKGARTEIAVEKLEGEERVREIARMLGAKGRSDTPLHHAQEIIETAERWKTARAPGASA